MRPSFKLNIYFVFDLGYVFQSILAQVNLDHNFVFFISEMSSIRFVLFRLFEWNWRNCESWFGKWKKIEDFHRRIL